MIPSVFEIQRRADQTSDTFNLELVSTELSERFSYKPGQFNMLFVPGFGEVAISISGSVGNCVLHTIRAVGPTTQALQRMTPGSQIGLRGPFGRPWPIEDHLEAHVVFVAGGIGLAPLRPAILALEAVAQRRSEMGLKTLLFYGARTPEDMIFAEDRARWSKIDGFEVETIVDAADSKWNGRVGVVTGLMENLKNRLAGSLPKVAMMCGPEIMMRFSAQKLLGHGFEAKNLFLSAERNMKCAVGFCGHCQYGPHFICKDGPVFDYDRLGELLRVREL